MLNVTVLAVGTLKESHWRQACEEYRKRLQAFCKLSILELPEYRLPQDPSPALIQKGLEEEGISILKALPKGACLFALCIEGKQVTSEAFSASLQDLSHSHSHVAFVIGGSHGLSPRVKEASARRLSISAMTFPHQLARILLLEQLYRAFSIAGGGKYHK